MIGGMSSDSDRRAVARLQVLFWFAIVISTMSAAYSVATARGLIYDGSYYLLAIAGNSGFHIFEAARVSVQVLQQLPAVLAARLGVQNLWTLGKLFSLGLSGSPVAITAACWFALPRNEKAWIVGPLVNLLFAIPAANFIGISEGIIASCLLWLAFLLVMFRLQRPLGAIAALATTAACAVAHEAAVIGLLLIGWLAATQYVRLRGAARLSAILVAIISVAGACYMTRWILFPRSSIERSDFLGALLGGFLGSPQAPNLPAIASLAAAISIATAVAWRARAAAAATVGAIAVLACAVIFAAMPEALASPSRFFAARALPLMVTTLIIAIFLVMRGRGGIPERIVTTPTLVVVVVLVLAQAGMQAVATSLWRGYTDDLRALVATSRGEIPHNRALKTLDPKGYRFRREMLQTWSVQPLSILLAPAGRVTSIVEPADTERWVPYRLTDPRTFPRMPQLDWSHFPETSMP